ncbi:MAG TPA: N-succinylarginine dihydrolase [Tepidisphaeraceae bacterium]|jgi:succinylarginine dihydrolase
MERPLALELNLDGLVGPTHNYAGLSFGNLASAKHSRSISHPRQAALEGLKKMKFLADLGVPQAVLPPNARPDLGALRRLGFEGSEEAVIAQAFRESPRLLAGVYSASSMWAANAATVSPGADTADGQVHFTPANLVSQFHRSLEPATTGRLLRAIFPPGGDFVHHDPLPAAPFVGDEGAANHMRLAPVHGGKAIEVFVYGGSGNGEATSANFPARQTLEASQAIARLHGLGAARTLFVRQSPEAIDAGAFHNDVVAVANESVMLYHARAYADGPSVAQQIREACDGDFHLIEVAEDRVPLTTAVESYLFNSQLVTLADGGMALIAPIECQERENVRAYIEELLAADNPIRQAHFLEVRQSMKNGGGPACLRLRVVLNPAQLQGVHPGVMLTDELYAKLINWVERRYREKIEPADLADPKLMIESYGALDELTQILGLGPVYDFQMGR